MNGSPQRRRFLALLGAGATGLAGCSSITDTGTVNDGDTNGDGTDGEQSQSQPQDEPQPPQFDPEESQYVANGQLTVRPFVDVFGFRSVTQRNVNVIMTAMPDPLADYEINVHYTPLSTVDTEWKITPVRSTMYGGLTPEYDDNTNTWEVTGGRPTVTTIREAKQSGVRIGTITVPSGAAGIMASDVPNPYDDENIQIEFTDDGEIEFAPDESRRQFDMWVDGHIPEQGANYPEFIQDQIDATDGLQAQFGHNTGSWLSGTGPITPPFVKQIDFSLSDDQLSALGITRHRRVGFPEQEPFVLTFTVDDPNAAYNDPEQIVAQTPTAIPGTGDGVALYTPDVRIPDNSAETWLQKDWTRGITNGREWGRIGIDELYREVDYTDSPDVTSGKVSRLTNYGRYSPKMDRYSERMLESDTAQTRAPEQFLATQPYAYLDSPIQAAWTIEYDVAKSQIDRAQQAATAIKNSNPRPERYTELAADAQTYDTIQTIIEQLRTVCEDIGTETPTEEIRVVADFVAHLEHIALDSDPPGKLEGFGTPGPQHPIWTLYHQTGDCQDFTALANTILSSDAFGYSPSAGVADSLAFSRGGSSVSHLSTAVPMGELEIDDVQNNALIEFQTEGRVEIQEDLQYTYDGEKYAYVEMSMPFPIGTTYGRRTRTADPEPLETWDG